MRHTHGGGGLVHVLSARAGGVVGIHAHVLHVDDDIALVVVQNGRDVQRGEGGVAARVGVKGADAHQAVHALLAAQVAVGMVAADLEGHGLHAGLVAVQVVQHLHGEAHLLAVAGVHAVEHLRPVLGLGAARTRMER